jgi:glycosyltransferase involved in cell wall biosynthesis
MVIAETMAAGKVVVSTAVGGIPEMIINEQNGFLFNIKDENAFYNILKLLYNNDGLLSDVGKKAKDFATTKYYCNKVAEKTIKFYNQIINSHNENNK